MTIGALVRNLLALIVVAITAAPFVVYAFWWSLEDRRPMTVRVQSALSGERDFEIRGGFAPQGEARNPVLRFEGLDELGRIRIAPGKAVDIPVSVEIPGGLWLHLTGRIATGDLEGSVRVEPIPATPEFPGEDLPLAVHIASAWEMWRPMVVVGGACGGLFVGLYVLSRYALFPPSGVLAIVQKSDSQPVAGGDGAPLRYFLTERRYHQFWFWNRDLLRVNTFWSPGLSVILPGASVVPFLIQFTQLGGMIRCPKGELETLDAFGNPRRVADVALCLRWRAASARASAQQSEQASPAEARVSAQALDSDNLLFAPLRGADKPEEPTELFDSLTLDEGVSIVAGEFLIVYRSG